MKTDVNKNEREPVIQNIYSHKGIYGGTTMQHPNPLSTFPNTKRGNAFGVYQKSIDMYQELNIYLEFPLRNRKSRNNIVLF